MQAGEATATVRPHLRAVFLTLTLPVNRGPSGVHQNKRPNSRQCPGEAELPGQADSSPASESHVTLLFREAPEPALFWVLKALALPEAPHQGSKGTQVPTSPERVPSVPTALLRPPNPPQQMGH